MHFHAASETGMDFAPVALSVVPEFVGTGAVISHFPFYKGPNRMECPGNLRRKNVAV
jgi:hypothetical protein